MWFTAREAATGHRASSELRKIADLLDKIEIDREGKAHPEIAAIAENLAAIRTELGKTVKSGSLSDDGRRAMANGFTNIGKALGTKSVR